MCACVFWGTLAARHLTASFLCAALSPVPAAALWLGWESAGCLELAFPCRSAPEQSNKATTNKRKAAIYTRQMKSLAWARECQERSLWRNTIKMPRLISASVSKTAQNHIRWRRGSAGRRVCTPHATPSVKLKSKWQDTVQISMNNAMMLKNG